MAGERILVVDDDSAIRRMLVDYLGTHGYAVHEAADGATLRQLIEADLPDVVLLDVNLPGEDGLTLARFLRDRYDVAIIMVTGAGETVDRILGLEMGADDYVTKPFDPRELRARIKSVLRRMQPTAQTAPAAGTERRAQDGRIRIGRCMLDLASRQLFDADGTDVPITAMEFDLLKTFIAHPNQVLTRDRLLTLTRNRSWEPFDRSIDIRITRLRRKVEADPDNPLAIRTVRGAGYMFVPPAA